MKRRADQKGRKGQEGRETRGGKGISHIPPRASRLVERETSSVVRVVARALTSPILIVPRRDRDRTFSLRVRHAALSTGTRNFVTALCAISSPFSTSYSRENFLVPTRSRDEMRVGASMDVLLDRGRSSNRE